MPRFLFILRLALNSAAQAGLNLVIFLSPVVGITPEPLVFYLLNHNFTREISFGPEGIHYR